ncbi:hypothetical protein B0H15DRAFT_502133 [Mycena belliarum]|uniref:Uncharacterized protein n=1 Tax=Mycena belliarum TaxID=1033014 RepID=A0AAD6XXK2_9AGAR|nr:hypothetical protein B0H15DRAFT_502133 [Mycena belliae]
MHPILSLLLASTLVLSVCSAPNRPEFYDPRALGGAWLNYAGPHKGGEPLNVIISGHSTPSVLTDTGFRAYAEAIGFAPECLGLHIGFLQAANLGDGHGWVKQIMELREDYGSSWLGACLETVVGGNHLRMYRQDGYTAGSGALFLAVSKEESLLQEHTISHDGYDAGRDLLVQRARGQITAKGITYTTTVRRLTGLMAHGAAGVNHGP